MDRRTMVHLSGFTLAALALTRCAFGGGASYRFRMTVEVQTPQGLKEGSSVYKVEAYKSFALTSEEKEGGGAFRGQATMIDLPGGPVFVLMRTGTAGLDLGEAATLALRPDAQTGHVDDYIAAVRALGHANVVKAELPHKDWPLIVRFRNFHDPATVVLVDPATVGIMRILVETTDAEISKGIDAQLNWLGHDRLTLGNQGTMGPPMGGSYLQNGDFWRSEK